MEDLRQKLVTALLVGLFGISFISAHSAEAENSKTNSIPTTNILFSIQMRSGSKIEGLDARAARLLNVEELKTLFLRHTLSAGLVVRTLRSDMVSPKAKRGPLGGMPNPTIKPAEKIFHNLIEALKFIQENGATARNRAEAAYMESSLRGLLSDYYTKSRDEKAQEGARAYLALKQAVTLDPTYEIAWIEVGDTIMDITDHSAWIVSIIEEKMGINYKLEIPFALKGLERFKNKDRVPDLIRSLQKRFKDIYE